MDRLAMLAAILVPAALAAAECEDPMREKYPDADAVLLDGVTETVYAPDGSYTTDDSNWVKILTEKGCREESEIVLPYNARFGAVEIKEVKITRADGTEREVDVSKTSSDSTDNSSAKDNIYDPMHRKLTVRVPGLKPGDTLFYRTVRKTVEPRVENLYASVFLMEWTSPIERQTIRIVAPRDLPLKRTVVKHSKGNYTYGAHPRADGSVAHEWVVSGTPQAFEEPNMPAMHTQVQALRVSTAGSWQEISKWYWGLCKGHLDKTSPEITNRVELVLSGLKPGATGIDRIKAVYKWVAQEIRYMGLTMEDKSPGYAPHDVDITFSNRYGVCRDKAALLVAMLRIAGFDAYPVLINAGAKMDEEVAMPYFNHAVVAVYAPGAPEANAAGYILMDPTDESSRDLLPSYLDDKSYLVARPEGESLLVSPVTPAGRNKVDIECYGRVDRNGILLMDATIAFTGLNDNTYRQVLLRKNDEDRRKTFERILAAAVPGAEMLVFEIEPRDLQRTEIPLSVKFSYRTAEAFLEGETREIFAVPFLSRAFGAANWILEGATSLDRRKYPLVVSSTAMTAERMNVEFDDRTLKPLHMPSPVEMAGDYSFTRRFSFNANVLKGERTLSINAVEFKPDAYDALREGIKRVETEERDRPVLAKDETSGADVRILSQSVAVNAPAPTVWVVTNSVVKQILTYDGKKRSAELKYYYNPLWQNVELAAAKVTGPDGREYSVSPSEMNVFDASWSSGAPRYPASRQLVVNLPGVEIGSVLSYIVVTTVTNSPLPYKSVWYFDRREPSANLEYSFNGPGGMSWSRTVERARIVPQEQMQPDDILWRDCKVINLGSIAGRAEYLKKAVDVSPVGFAELEAGRLDSETDKIAAVRRWMSRNVRLAGPSLNELPLESQLSEPSVVLRERYATRVDYIRTMAALLKGLGLDATVVFAADDARDNPELVDYLLNGISDGSVFSTALCRVSPKSKWPWRADARVYWIGTESEWAELESTAWKGAHYLDPSSGEIGIVESGDRQRVETGYVIEMRENGSVDVECLKKYYGASTDAIRKTYEEMLPEDRSRHFQEILGELSQNASATRELQTDTKSYPASLSYSAFIPNYATIAGGMATVSVPGVARQFFRVAGATRKTPLGVPSEEESVVTVKIVFPKGYETIEQMPAPYTISDPCGDTGPWYDFSVEDGYLDDGRLTVTLTRKSMFRREQTLGADFLPLLKEWSRMGLSRANRTVSVRKCGQ